MTVALALTPVSAMPVKPEREGPGRPSAFGPILDQIRNAGPGNAYQITAEPMVSDGKTDKAAATASRIRNGNIAGTQPGEFNAQASEGHVFVEYVGQSGIQAAVTATAKRELNKQKKAAKAAAQAGAAPAAPAPVGEQLANGEW